MSVGEQVRELCSRAKEASRRLTTLGSEPKNRVLLAMASGLAERAADLKAANQKDLAAAAEAGLSAALIDRLTLSDQVIASMAQGLKEVAALPDPVGEVTSMWRRPNGLLVGRQRIPLGVIGFIYESRPNVTVDAAGLCLKSGNAVVLKGGKEALHSNLALGEIIAAALAGEGIPAAAAAVIPTTDRAATGALLQQDELVDVIIPRGGEGLIRFVAENSRIPVLKHYQGVCHVYVDQGCDHQMAEEIAINAKVSRPGVCNAMETLLVHRAEAKQFIPRIVAAMEAQGVEVRGCPQTCQLAPSAKQATEQDWPCEYLDLILAVKVVEDMEQAMAHIAAYGSDHSEAIVTRDYQRARRFVDAVNSSAVFVNCSTRFNDGGELGLGAEIGINTSKLHAFGPMGLAELTTSKFVVYGQGQVRG